MYSPSLIFRLAQRNPIIKRFVSSWDSGCVEWETMLFELAKQLESRCNEVVGENGLREILTRRDSLNIPNYVLDISLTPCLNKQDPPLKRQSELIEAILRLHEYYEILLKILVERKRKESPVLILNIKRDN